MRERDIEGAFTRFAKKRGCLALKFTSPGHAGVPDRMVLTPVGCFFIEFKAPGKKPTALQNRMAEIFREFGETVLVIDTPGEAERYLDSILEILK